MGNSQPDEFDAATALLAVWRKFPYGDDRAAFTTALREGCDGKPDRAEWLVSQRSEFSEYPGPQVLRKMIADHFNPTGPNAPYQKMAPPAPTGRRCKACDGWGCVRVGGRWEYCRCPDGYDLREKVPAYLDFCNSIQPSNSKSGGFRRASDTIASVVGEQASVDHTVRTVQANSPFAMQSREPGDD